MATIAGTGRSGIGGGGGSGADIFGRRPSPIATPDPFGDLSGVYDNLSGTNAQVSSNILSKLRGELSPNTINAIQDAAARFGVGAGVSGSGLQFNKSLRDIGVTSEQMQQQGLQDYASIIPTISGTQTVRPELQTEINTQNALFAAGPDPAAAGTYAQSLFDKYLRSMNPGGGTGEFLTSPWANPDEGRVVSTPYGQPRGSNLYAPGGIAR